MLQQIVDVAREHELMIFSDEIYDRLVMDDYEHVSIASLAPDLFCVTFSGLSKSHMIAGYRIGWMVLSGNKALGKDYIEGLNMLSNMRLCSNVPAQSIVQTALGGYQSVGEYIVPGGRIYEQREYVYKALNDIPGISAVKPKAAFYIFPKIDTARFNITNDEQFALDLLREKKILIIHGGGFNWDKPDHFRVVYLPRTEILKDATGKLADFLSSYKPEIIIGIDNYKTYDILRLLRGGGCIMDTNILLESGTNELEVLEFTLGDNHYGINVAKIREILQYMPVTPVPNTHPSVEGIFMPRDTMITVINLKNCLNLPQTDEKGLFIITNFNKLNVAFHVDQVIGIHRVSWENIIKPDETLTGEQGSTATGVIKMDDRLIVILDFEAIVASISPETGLRVNDIDEMEARDRSDATILIAEDSALLSKLITECLKKSGYTNLIVEENGQEAWDVIKDMQAKGDITKHLDCIITDIEMPLMDGHRLTKLVKSDAELRDIPVIIFSSLVNEEMRKKGEQLGADAQLTKPEIGKLVEAIDKLLDKA